MDSSNFETFEKLIKKIKSYLQKDVESDWLIFSDNSYHKAKGKKSLRL